MTLMQDFRAAMLVPLYQARAEAAEAHRKALLAADTQRVKETRERLHAATHAALAAELRLSSRGRL